MIIAVKLIPQTMQTYTKLLYYGLKSMQQTPLAQSFIHLIFNRYINDIA